jgi:hypothetical protein
MEQELKASTSSTAVVEAPSYQPPAHEPQGLEPAKDDKSSPDQTTAEEKKEPDKPTVTLPASIKPPTKTGRFQERISDLVGQRDASKREAETLREQLTSLQRATPQHAKPGAPLSAPATDGTLNPEEFGTYGEYVAALVEQTMARKAASEETRHTRAAYDTHKQERMTSFNEHAAPLVQQYGEGFWDTITDPALPITEAMADAVMELDQLGPYTMLYLAAHKDEAKRIAQLNPRAATIAIGRLAAQLDQEIKQGGGTEPQEMNGLTQPTLTMPAGQTRPTLVPVPRGSTPNLSATPGDKDTVDEWLRKETDRLRRINPNSRFYGARIIAGLALLGALLAAPLMAEASCQIILIPDGQGGQRSCQVCTWPNGQTSTTCS